MLNKLFAPGPLSESHKHLEEADCLACHDAGKGLPVEKCLACHDEIRPFIEQKKGYHGLAKQECKECHVEHKGRDFDSTNIDQKKFDHDLTGYKLLGKHADIKCSECHKEKRKDKRLTEKRKIKPVRPNDIRYIGTHKTCLACHKKDDVHYFKGTWAKKDCDTCHGLDKWKADLKFDHAKDTKVKYKLEGKHAEMKCAECHVPGKDKTKKQSRYSWPDLKTKQCLSCHKDHHGRNLTKRFQNGRCSSCHSQKEWEIEKFDHKITKYPLRGKHSELKCAECHKQTKDRLAKGEKAYNWAGLKQDCLACHADYHAFDKYRVGKNKMKLRNCMTCHNEAKWDQIHEFEHNKDTRYDIDGKHLGLKCEECHKATKTKWMQGKRYAAERQYFWKDLNSKTCENCHKNPHTRSFSKEFLKKKCTECHVTSDWYDRADGKKFNHDQTRFKLTGEHIKLKCQDCHTVNKKQVFRFSSDKKDFCVDCHKSPHDRQFHTKFSDQACSACHTTKDFKKRLDFDHGTAQFTLKGKHQKLKCEECHTPERKEVLKDKRNGIGPVTWHKYVFKDLSSKSCMTCHKDYHSGQLTQKCDTCHNENSWKKNTFNHDRDSVFPLRGKHTKLKCSECHKVIRGQFVEFGKKKYRVVRYKPIDTACVGCHKEDDVHKGDFGKNCNECHNERSWELTKDFHRNFTLQGVHYMLKCSECHINDRRLGGMSDNCILCHQKDDVHKGSLPTCQECHTQHFWEVTSFRHSRTLFPLRGSHRAVDCFTCHRNGFYQGTPSDCIDCHRADAPLNANHRVGGVGAILPDREDCQRCHSQFVWQ